MLYFTCDLADKRSFDALDSIAIIIRHKDVFVQSVLLQRLFVTTPKKTRQGSGQHTKYAASSRNGAKKRYRGQGR